MEGTYISYEIERSVFIFPMADHRWFPMGSQFDSLSVLYLHLENSSLSQFRNDFLSFFSKNLFIVTMGDAGEGGGAGWSTKMFSDFKYFRRSSRQINVCNFRVLCGHFYWKKIQLQVSKWGVFLGKKCKLHMGSRDFFP